MNKRERLELACSFIVVTLIVILSFVFISCKPDTTYIDHYRVGDQVEIEKLAKGCYGVILEYIPMSKYRVKIKCPFIIPYTLSEAVFNEVFITGRHESK